VTDQEPVVRPVPIIVCHSVKGGTGRTITAIATALSWSRRERRPVLLVDADVEAPGISYMFRATRRETRVSLEDLVAIAHADPDPDRVETTRWVADRLADHRLGELVVLPLRRDLDELASSSIRAEHLASPDHPYAFADLLGVVAQRLECVGDCRRCTGGARSNRSATRPRSRCLARGRDIAIWTVARSDTRATPLCCPGATPHEDTPNTAITCC